MALLQQNIHKHSTFHFTGYSVFFSSKTLTFLIIQPKVFSSSRILSNSALQILNNANTQVSTIKITVMQQSQIIIYQKQKKTNE